MSKTLSSQRMLCKQRRKARSALPRGSPIQGLGLQVLTPCVACVLSFQDIAAPGLYLSLIFVWNLAVIILEGVVVELILKLFFECSKGNNMQ
jgi:hypothetical protein